MSVPFVLSLPALFLPLRTHVLCFPCPFASWFVLLAFLSILRLPHFSCSHPFRFNGTGKRRQTKQEGKYMQKYKYVEGSLSILDDRIYARRQSKSDPTHPKSSPPLPSSPAAPESKPKPRLNLQRPSEQAAPRARRPPGELAM